MRLLWYLFTHTPHTHSIHNNRLIHSMTHTMATHCRTYIHHTTLVKEKINKHGIRIAVVQRGEEWRKDDKHNTLRGPALPEPYSYFTGELMQMSAFNCASLVHWLHANVFHLLTVLLYSYFNYSEDPRLEEMSGYRAGMRL